MGWMDIFESFEKSSKKETHWFWGKGKEKRVYLKEGPKSSGRKGKTIIWTDFKDRL